jgi:hypothetical protein
MAEGLPRKKRIRTGHRGSATRILSLTEDLLDETVVDEPSELGGKVRYA